MYSSRALPRIPPYWYRMENIPKLGHTSPLKGFESGKEKKKKYRRAGRLNFHASTKILVSKMDAIVFASSTTGSRRALAGNSAVYANGRRFVRGEFAVGSGEAIRSSGANCRANEARPGRIDRLDSDR